MFEKHINHHLMGYLNNYKLIHEIQSFRHKHSCQTALIKLINQWKERNAKSDIVGTLFIDFRKAFDVVDHNILLRKLKIYKFSSNAIQWFQSYLECRQQALVMPRLHLRRSSYDLFVYDFLYDVFGIVGGYTLRRMRLHCVRSPYDFFRRQTRAKLYRDLIVQSS